MRNGPCATTVEVNLHDLHNRDIGHRVLQLGNRRSDELSGPWRLPLHRERDVATVLLVHNGHDAEHHEPANQGRENSARYIVTSNASLAHATGRKKSLENLRKKTDHGNLHLRHDRGVDEQHCGISTVFTQTATKNLHDLQTGTSTTVSTRHWGNSVVRQDRGNLSPRREGNVDDLKELQLRNFRSFLQSEPRAAISWEHECLLHGGT